MRAIAGMAIVLSCTLVGLAAQGGQAQGQGQGGGRAGGGQQAPQNLQVLSKDMTRQQLLPVMQSISRALGVECTHCHVQDRASDEKEPKKIARKMLQMTMAINDTYLKDIGTPAPAGTNKVSCYTCHRGAVKPLTAPPSGGN